jgi:hypothetical protein
VRLFHLGLVLSIAGVASCSGPADPALPALQPTLTLSTDRERARINSDSVQITWTSKNATICSASGAWSGSQPISGSLTFKPDREGMFTFTLTCTGAGGEASATATLEAWQPLRVLPTSYLNFKDVGISPTPIPNSATRGYGDFFQNGSRALFTASQQYNRDKPIAEAKGALFQFWRFTQGKWVLDNSILSPPSATCVHPRQALVADFNGDAQPDVFLACTGYDGPPYPGERNQLVLSSVSGTYHAQFASENVGFWHGASAADITGDGRVDIVVAAGRGVVLFVGDGSGNFILDSVRLQGLLPTGAPFYAVQVLDVDQDGRLDILVGGHEYTGCAGCNIAAPTTVLLNTAAGSYEPVVLPPIENQGTVLDFAVTGTGTSRVIWVNRSSGGATVTPYNGRVLQRVVWSTLLSSVPYSDAEQPWVQWILPVRIGASLFIASDDTRDTYAPVSVP